MTISPPLRHCGLAKLFAPAQRVIADCGHGVRERSWATLTVSAYAMTLPLCASTVARAHWISLQTSETELNIATICVSDNRRDVESDGFVGDLNKFKPLIPDELFRHPAGSPGPDERLGNVCSDGVRIVTGRWAQLEAQPRRSDVRSLEYPADCGGVCRDHHIDATPCSARSAGSIRSDSVTPSAPAAQGQLCDAVFRATRGGYEISETLQHAGSRGGAMPPGHRRRP